MPDIKKLITKDFVLIFFAPLFFVSPGVAVILVYFPDWLIQLDSTRLILVALTVMTPAVALFWLQLGMLTSNTFDENDDRDAFKTLFFSLFISALTAYGALLLVKIFRKILNFQDDFISYLEVFGILCFIVMAMLYLSEKKIKKSA